MSNLFNEMMEEISEKDKKISDLEAKLAESEKSKEINIKERDKICLEMATEYNREIMQLKQQLAEKEKEETKRMEVFEKGCQEYYKSNQTAIAELEKVKEIFEKGYQGCRDFVELYAVFSTHIDQQIKSLKGEK